MFYIAILYILFLGFVGFGSLVVLGFFFVLRSIYNWSTFAGGVFLHANPAEKHCVQQSMLGQQKQETCAGKTVSTGI